MGGRKTPVVVVAGSILLEIAMDVFSIIHFSAKSLQEDCTTAGIRSSGWKISRASGVSEAATRRSRGMLLMS